MGTARSIGDAKSVPAPDERDRDRDSGPDVVSQDVSAPEMKSAESKGDNASAGEHGSGADDSNLHDNTTNVDRKSNAPAGQEPRPESGADGSKGGRHGPTMEGIASMGTRRRSERAGNKHDLWTAGVSVGLRSSNRQALDKLKDSRQF